MNDEELYNLIVEKELETKKNTKNTTSRNEDKKEIDLDYLIDAKGK